MPVRIVTAGGDPVRIVTSGISDPVRVVTSGLSTPVVIIGGGLAPDAPTFVSGEVGTVDALTVVVTFSTDISAPCGDCALGFTVLVNAAPDAVTACVIVGGNTVQLTLTTAVANGDVVTISYNSAVGCIMESTGVTDLATFGAQAVTNNVAAIPWYLSGGIAAADCLAAYTPKGAASLAASYDNNAAPGNGLPDGTYDAAPGTAPTLAAGGWVFDGATQYLTTGITPTFAAASSPYSMLVQFSNLLNNGGVIAGEFTINEQYRILPDHAGVRVIYGNGGQDLAPPPLTNGNLAIAGTNSYRNGAFDIALSGGIAGVAESIYIGASNQAGGVATAFCQVTIQALAIYSSTLTAPQVAAVAAAMALL